MGRAAVDLQFQGNSKNSHKKPAILLSLERLFDNKQPRTKRDTLAPAGHRRASQAAREIRRGFRRGQLGMRGLLEDSVNTRCVFLLHWRHGQRDKRERGLLLIGAVKCDPPARNPIPFMIELGRSRFTDGVRQPATSEPSSRAAGTRWISLKNTLDFSSEKNLWCRL